MKKQGAAIIGCGMIAENHAQAIIEDGRVELVAAVYGSNKESAEKFANKYKINDLTNDYKELCAREDINMVFICTPSGLHSECAVDFANAGKHILCEKPLDINSQAVTKMIDAAVENDVKLGCVFPNRTRIGLIRAKALLDSGELGKMNIVECQYRGYRSPAYYKSSNWKGTQALDGGGCLINQGIHGIDAMMYLTGDVDSVIAQKAALGRDIEVEDTANALLTFKNGALGVLMGTTLSYIPEEAPEGDRIRIECEHGSILYANGKTTYYKNIGKNDFDVQVISLDDNLEDAISSGSKPENIDMGAHLAIVSDFITAVLEDKEVLIPANSARRGVDLVLAIYESARTGRSRSVSYGE